VHRRAPGRRCARRAAAGEARQPRAITTTCVADDATVVDVDNGPLGSLDDTHDHDDRALAVGALITIRADLRGKNASVPRGFSS
jgi:hypothetical protein